jgi:hypothetical protein
MQPSISEGCFFFKLLSMFRNETWKSALTGTFLLGWVDFVMRE